SLTAGTTVHIGQKIDQHTEATVVANGDVVIDQKIDHPSDVKIPSTNGSVHIGQALSGFAKARLIADNGDIRIDDSVDGGSTLDWAAAHVSSPHHTGATR